MEDIKNINELAWFQIDDYKPIKNLSVSRFYDEIVRRREVILFDHEKEERALALLNNPILNDAHYKGITIQSVRSVVRQPSWNEFYSRSSKAKEYYKDSNDKQSVHYSLHKAESEIYSDHKVKDEAIYLRIDLNAKNSVIEAAFKKEIQKVRAKYNLTEPLEAKRVEAIIKKIISTRAIQYIDLKIWSTINNKSIPAKVMAGILFPDNFNIEAREINEQTKKYADIALEDSFINSIYLFVEKSNENQKPICVTEIQT